MNFAACDGFLDCFIGVVTTVALDVSCVRVLALSNSHPQFSKKKRCDKKVETHSLSPLHSRLLVAHLQYVYFFDEFQKRRESVSHTQKKRVSRMKTNRSRRNVSL